MCKECPAFFGVMDDFADRVFRRQFVSEDVACSHRNQNWLNLKKNVSSDCPMVLFQLFAKLLETFDGWTFVFQKTFERLINVDAMIGMISDGRRRE